MLKKSTTRKIKSMIYPLAFILIILLSALYKLVFRGDGSFSIRAFKSGKTAAVTEASSSENVMPQNSPPTDTYVPEPSETVQFISVYICGEVNNPGIYDAPKGVMLNDIIEDAGGLTKDASVNNINLVYQITNNMSIYIPSREEISHGFTGGDIIRQDGVYVWGSSSGGTSDTGSGTVMVNINTASEEELKSLPGIGDVTARAIIDYRKDTPFDSTEDIKNVTGIGDAKYNRIKDYICI